MIISIWSLLSVGEEGNVWAATLAGPDSARQCGKCCSIQIIPNLFNHNPVLLQFYKSSKNYHASLPWNTVSACVRETALPAHQTECEVNGCCHHQTITQPEWEISPSCRDLMLFYRTFFWKRHGPHWPALETALLCRVRVSSGQYGCLQPVWSFT